MICVQYSRPASGQNDSEVFGLDVAVNNLLTAYFRYGASEKFICRPSDMPSFAHFKSLATDVGVDAETRCIGLDPRAPQHNLSGISVLFRPDPLTADLTWRRQHVQGGGFATCGVVHTMSGERIARAVGELCTAPSDGTDALICPSEAIRDVVRNLWDIHADYLNHRFGGAFRCPVQTPVIPLGIDTAKFTRLTTPEKRAAQRAALGAAADEIVILFVGRLSFATKAHPLALWQAAEKAAARTKKKIRVVMFGYFKPADMEASFRKLATDVVEKAQIDFVMNDDPRFPEGLWAGADIFASLSDNIQESFGLTPIEAMASGLPAVISDWNGYRGGVRDGQEGFLIPTLTPPVSAGKDIADYYFNHENYGVALMGAVQSTAVDRDVCAEAFAKLANDDALRNAMGQRGRERARDVYDWKHIIKAYETLWAALAEKRRTLSAPRVVPEKWDAAHPAFPNPYKMFDSFPSRLLSLADHVRVVMGAEEIARLMRHEMNYFVPELLVPREQMPELIEVIRRAGLPQVQDILNAFPASGHDRLLRCLGWMLKHGVCVVAKGAL